MSRGFSPEKFFLISWGEMAEGTLLFPQFACHNRAMNFFAPFACHKSVFDNHTMKVLSSFPSASWQGNMYVCVSVFGPPPLSLFFSFQPAMLPIPDRIGTRYSFLGNRQMFFGTPKVERIKWDMNLVKSW